MRDKFTICVLLYGDHPGLADRCLRSITQAVAADDLNLVVILNSVPPDISDWVKSWVPDDRIVEVTDNPGKYPLMRRVLHESDFVETPYFMWFDDDSYLEGFSLEQDAPAKPWLSVVSDAMEDADLLGGIYTMRWMGKQREFVMQQPWYGGKSPAGRSSIKFATGGWWTARTDVLRRFNYPWPALHHNGGDTMLGELFFQQDLRLKNFRTGVRINADELGRESKAPRRGITGGVPLGVEEEVVTRNSPTDALHHATQPLS